MTDQTIAIPDYAAMPLGIYRCRTVGCEMEGVASALPVAEGLRVVCGPCGVDLDSPVPAARGTKPGVQPDLDS